MKKPRPKDWREEVFKRRGLMLAPIALALVIFGRPSLLSAEAGIAVALAGEAMRIWAVGYSGASTRSSTVTASQLVTAGPYALVRHPLYIGNVLVAIGFAVAFTGGIPSGQAIWLFVFVLAVLALVYFSIIPLEEEYLARTFGVKYSEYTTLVPRFLPWRGELSKDRQHGSWNRSVIWEAEVITLGFFALMLVVVVLKLGPLARFTLVF